MLKRLRYVLLILVVVGVGITGFALYFRSAGNATSLLRPNDWFYVKRGAEIYAAACASCHGAPTLEGKQIGEREGQMDSCQHRPTTKQATLGTIQTEFCSI